jgi:hypothetical protein
MILLTSGLLLVFISGLLLGKQFGPRFCAAYEKGYAKGYDAALDDYPPEEGLNE